MSDAELERLEVLRDVDRGGLPVRAAAQLLVRSEGVAVVEGVSGCGCLGLDLQEARPAEQPQDGGGGGAAALWIVRHNYADFGPTLAAEKLAGDHGFSFSSETLRKWMIADGLWLD